MRNIYFYLIITFYLLGKIWEQFLSYLDRTRMSPVMPRELEGIYEAEAYARQQAYQKENSRFDMVTDTVSFVISALFLWNGWLGPLDDYLRQYAENPVLLAILFFGVIIAFSWVISIPFDWYDHFVIEEKYGFNKMTPRIFVTDHIKTIFLALILDSIIVGIVIIALEYIDSYSWVWAWAGASIFGLVLSYFYSEWIVPLFNKQTPLEEGELRAAIEDFARKVSFPIRNIYVIDGSKRSTKSNAYFSGFGKKKRIVLYDTLMNDVSTEEIVAVLAHEIGHYKKKHIIYTIARSLASTAAMLWIMTLFVRNPDVSHALGATVPSLHFGLAGFSLLYSPVSDILDFLSNYISRKNEYEADDFAISHGLGDALISSLRIISSKALSNLTPHPFVVFWSYSHPTLLQRMANVSAQKRS